MSKKQNKHIESVWRLLGTSTAPHKDKDNFLNTVDTYRAALEKMNAFTQAQKDIQNLFIKYPELQFFECQVVIHGDGEHSIDHVAVYTGDKNINLLLITQVIQSTLGYNQIFLKHFSTQSLAFQFVIDKNVINNILDKILTPQETEVFYAVENFEKNRLEEQISTKKSKQKIPKI